MRSNGITCQAGNATMAITQASQRSSQASSGCEIAAEGAAAGGCSGREPVTLTAHRLYQGESELYPEPPDAHVDNVGAGIELDSPDRGKQLALGHRVMAVLHQSPQAEELESG